MARILVADDSADTRELFHAVLASADHKVILAADGFEALRLYREHRPDLLLLDIFMPGKDGIETIIELRREFPTAKIIAISAGWQVPNFELLDELKTVDVLEHAQSVGADRVMQKPVNAGALLEMVDEVLGASR